MSTPQELEKVKSGYTALDSIDRKALRQFVEDFERKNLSEQQTITKTFSEVRNKALGPTNNANCPCCGK